MPIIILILTGILTCLLTPLVLFLASPIRFLLPADEGMVGMLLAVAIYLNLLLRMPTDPSQP